MLCYWLIPPPIVSFGYFVRHNFFIGAIDGECYSFWDDGTEINLKLIFFYFRDWCVCPHNRAFHMLLQSTVCNICFHLIVNLLSKKFNCSHLFSCFIMSNIVVNTRFIENSVFLGYCVLLLHVSTCCDIVLHSRRREFLTAPFCQPANL